jgi:L-fuculose-phosphate aldolase
MNVKHIKQMKALRKKVARCMRRLYKQGLTTASGGNISVRVEEGIFITPSAIDKGTIRGKQIGFITFEGKNLTPGLKPSIEYAMHLSLYRVRPDIRAIVHAHPPLATSFTAMGRNIDCTLIAEARAVLGTPVVAAYALMGTNRLAETVAAAAIENPPGKPNVILMENHGVVCLGTDLLAAFDRLEVLEAAARMTMITDLMGNSRPLTPEQLKEIDTLMNP